MNDISPREIWLSIVGWENLSREQLWTGQKCSWSYSKTMAGWKIPEYPTKSTWFGEPCHIHFLVCTAFHGPKPSENHQVAHADGCPSNVRSDNLRWATPRKISKIAYCIKRNPAEMFTERANLETEIFH